MNCVETNWVSSAGSYVNDFEAAIAGYSGARRGVAIVNGTCALELGLRLAGVGPGDTVIIPDWTFVATANAVCHTGATPHFVDITGESWTLDPALVEQAVADASSRVAAIVPVHALGHPADMDPILEIANRHGIPVVEDAAGAVGATYRGRPIGSLGSFATMFSFNGNKLLTCGNGGMLVTDDEALADRAKRLSAQARQSDAYLYDEVAFNYRMSNVNAAIGLAQFERLEEMLAVRKRIAQRYRDALERSSEITYAPSADWADPNGWMSAVLCADAAQANALIAALDAAGIDARPFWESLSDQPLFARCGKTLNGVTQSLAGRVVSLPCSSSLTEADQEQVVAVIKTLLPTAG